MSRDYPFQVQSLTGAMGARISGVNLSEDLDAETFAAVTAALHEYWCWCFLARI